MTAVIGDVLKITCKMRLLGTDDVQNVYTYKITGGTLPDDLQIMQGIAAHMDTGYLLINARVSTALAYVTVDGINITQSVLMPEVPWPVLTAGLEGANLLPTQVAACVFWPTTTPKVRSSSFLGGFTETDNGFIGEIGAGLLGVLNTFGVFMQGMVQAEISADKGSFNPLTSTFTASGSPQVPTRWRTQRRRRVGVGS